MPPLAPSSAGGGFCRVCPISPQPIQALHRIKHLRPPARPPGARWAFVASTLPGARSLWEGGYNDPPQNARDPGASEIALCTISTLMFVEWSVDPPPAFPVDYQGSAITRSFSTGYDRAFCTMSTHYIFPTFHTSPLPSYYIYFFYNWERGGGGSTYRTTANSPLAILKTH